MNEFIWNSVLGSLVGGGIAGPWGAILGAMTGSIVSQFLPSATDVAGNVLGNLGSDGIHKAANHVKQSATRQETDEIRDDLLDAAHEALREALFDIGGSACFPEEWPRKNKPPDIVFIVSSLRVQGYGDLADRVCDCFKEMVAHVDNCFRAPFYAQENYGLYTALDAPILQDIAHEFYLETADPVLSKRPELLSELRSIGVAFDLELHLQRRLYGRTLTHLGNILKDNTRAWRAFNQMLLLGMQTGVVGISAAQRNIENQLNELQEQFQGFDFSRISDSVADLIIRAGDATAESDEDFDQLLERTIDNSMELQKVASELSLFHDLLKGIEQTVVEIYQKDLHEHITSESLIKACQTQIRKVLSEQESKYRSDLYVSRELENELENFIGEPIKGAERNCFLLIAPAGSGKTNLLCNLAERHMIHQPIVLLLGGSISLDEPTGLLGTVQTALEMASPEISFESPAASLHTIARLADETNQAAIILIDAINEYTNPQVMRTAIQNLLTWTRGKQIKIVVTCRDYYWGIYNADFWGKSVAEVIRHDLESIEQQNRSFYYFSLDEYEEALEKYLSSYRVSGGKPVGAAAEKCRHPLLLRFFCEAYEGQEIDDVLDIRLKELFDLYWERKLDSIADRRFVSGEYQVREELSSQVGDSLLNVAGHMLHNRIRTVPRNKVQVLMGETGANRNSLSIYQRVRDESIILEEKSFFGGQPESRNVAFVYEEFMEYAMARSLMKYWESNGRTKSAISKDITDLSSDNNEFVQIMGVLIYLSLMIRDRYNFAIWPLLLNESKQTQKVFFELLRKLPSDQLDVDLFEALADTLGAGDESLTKKTLDALKIKRIGQLAPPNVVQLVGLLTKAREPIARRAVLSLGYMSPDQALPILAKTLSDSRGSIQGNTRNALSRLAQNSTAFAISSLANSRWQIRRAAIVGLASIDDKHVRQQILVCCIESDSEVRKTAFDAIRRIDKKAPSFLIDALTDPNPSVREAGAVALGELGDLRAVEPLLRATEDPVSSVAIAAASSHAKLTQTFYDDFAGSPSAKLRTEGDELTPVRRAHIFALEQGTELRSRMDAAKALGEFTDEEAYDALVRALDDDTPQVREAAIESLSKLKNKEAIGYFIEAMGDSNWSVRYSASDALISHGLDAVEPLIVALQSPKRHVIVLAIHCLGTIGDPAAERALTAHLDSDSLEVQAAALSALRKIDTDTARATVEDFENSDR